MAASDYLLLIMQFAGLNNSLAEMLRGVWVRSNVPVSSCESLHRLIGF